MVFNFTVKETYCKSSLIFVLSEYFQQFPLEQFIFMIEVRKIEKKQDFCQKNFFGTEIPSLGVA